MTTPFNFEKRLEPYLSTHLFSPEHISGFSRYLSLLLKWNKVYNLTSITDPQDMVTRHILDSLVIYRFLEGNKLIDVGTGAGLPGIPLALISPNKYFILLDSSSKKIRFLTQVILELKLSNVSVACSRVEDYQPSHCFDHVLTRAFSSLSEMLAKTKHLCCPHGTFLAMKGIYPTEELREISSEFVVTRIEPLTVPDLSAERHLAIISRQ